MSKDTIQVEIVGAQTDEKIGRSVIYVQFIKNEKPMPNQLWALTHPGNLTVERWRDGVAKYENEVLAFDSTNQTKQFFKTCIRPVNDSLTDLEKDLIEKFGKNESPKPDPDRLHPKLFGVWQKLQSRFLSGDIFDELPELGDSPDGIAVEISSKGKGQK